MNLGLFAILFLLGSFSVAVWAQMRFPALAPATLKTTFFHVLAAMVGAQLLAPLAMHLLVGSPALTIVAVFAVGFPALVYTLLVAIWVIVLMQSMLRGRFR